MVRHWSDPGQDSIAGNPDTLHHTNCHRPDAETKDITMTTAEIQNIQPLAVCLHASASSSRQWLKLQAGLEPHVRTVAPSMVGYGADLHKRGTRFTFDSEIDNVMRQIEEQTGKANGPLHLIGHSYGGATALQIALRYPERVASLTLYEPVQMALLFAEGLESAEAREVVEVREYIAKRLRTPFGRWAAARYFIEYWSGKGVWKRITFKRRRRFASLMPKVVAEFDALLSTGVTAADFTKLNIPVRLLCGTKTRRTARKVAEILVTSLPNVEFIEVEKAAHMAPTTDAARINPLFAEHVVMQLAKDLEVAA